MTEGKKLNTSTGGGYGPVEEVKPPKPVAETLKERKMRQHQERQAELKFTSEDYARWDRNREKRLLEIEAQKATEELLIFLPALKLETSIHSQAVKEFSEAYSVILKGYNGGNISYETGYDLIHKIKSGFIDGGGALRKIEDNRQARYTEKLEHTPQDTAYRRNMVVNNESFNVRFKASCATPECLMRNANIDMEDDAFQAYIEAATQDKRSDVMQVIGVSLIANPYLKPLEYAVYGDIAYSGFIEKNLDPFWAYAMGAGTYYRLRLLNTAERVRDTSENVVSYISGNVLSED